MDPKRFDALVRTLRASGSRRAAVRLLTRSVLTGAGAGLGLASLDSPTATAKQKKRRRKRGHGCTVGPDGAIRVVAASRFGSKRLRLLQTTASVDETGNGASQTAVKLGRAPLLTIVTEEQGGQLTARFSYHAPIAGVKEARFSTTGDTLEGEIDGQPIAPLPLAAGPDQLRMANGDPPPALVVDPDLEAAITALLQQAEQAAAPCQPPASAAAHARAGQASGQHVGTAALRYDPCLAPYIDCRFQYLVCLLEAGAAPRGLRCSVCWALALWQCRVASQQCAAAIASRRCGADCVDTQSDVRNCGSCGKRCPGSQPDASPACCAGACTDLYQDVFNCGSCGHKCRVGEPCDLGFCHLDCAQEGEQCSDVSDCCDAYSCIDGKCHQTCQDFGESCSTVDDCCGGIDLCAGGVCCTNYGHNCQFAGECCYGVPCTAGRCVYT